VRGSGAFYNAEVQNVESKKILKMSTRLTPFYVIDPTDSPPQVLAALGD
jgi:hypothetical protein